jgi:hypothetical protein
MCSHIISSFPGLVVPIQVVPWCLSITRWQQKILYKSEWGCIRGFTSYNKWVLLGYKVWYPPLISPIIIITFTELYWIRNLRFFWLEVPCPGFLNQIININIRKSKLWATRLVLMYWMLEPDDLDIFSIHHLSQTQVIVKLCYIITIHVTLQSNPLACYHNLLSQ